MVTLRASATWRETPHFFGFLAGGLIAPTAILSSWLGRDGSARGAGKDAMARDTKAGDGRSDEELRTHYLVESELAARLRNATREERRHLYRTVYDELFKRVPLHPNLTRTTSTEAIQAEAAGQLRLLRRFLSPEQTFLELGAGDCALSFAVAPLVKKVYAVDVSSAISPNSVPPPNFQLILFDGFHIELPANSIDLAYSNQVLEHIHPDDALEQLQNVHRVLAPGGRYVCITPNRLDGPHDISRHFTAEATGFHLREYTFGEASGLFRRAGFSRTSAFCGVKGRFFRVPVPLLKSCETLLDALPRPLRKVLTNNLAVRLFMPIRLVATK